MKKIFEEIFLLDEEEIFLLMGSLLSLLFTTSFIFYFIRLLKSQINFLDIPIITIVFLYLNNLIWYTYSKYILYDLMKICYLISIIISLIFIMIYLVNEFSQDKIDALLNIFLIISATLALNKFLMEVLNDEDKIKMCCSDAIIFILFGLLSSIFRTIHIKSNNNLSFCIGISLILMCGCHFIYGIFYKEIFFIITNLAGILLGIIYLGFIFYFKINYSSLKEFRADSVIDIDVKNEEKEKNNIKNKEENISMNEFKK